MAEDKNAHRWVVRGDRYVYLAPGADDVEHVATARVAPAVEGGAAVDAVVEPDPESEPAPVSEDVED